MLIRSILMVLVLSLTACGGGAGDPGTDSRDFRLSGPTSTVTVRERETLKLYLAAIGAGDRPVTFSLHDGPAYARLEGNLLTLSPRAGDAGIATFSVSASDGVLTDTGVLTVEVMPLPNQLPAISGNFGIHNEDMTSLFYDAGGMGHYSRGEPRFRLHAVDPEGDTYRIFVEVRPDGEPFQRTPTHESALVPSGDTVVVPLTGLVEGQRYKLQWRLEDERGARMTDWYFSSVNVSVWTVTGL